MAPEAAARDHPNCSVSGFRKTVKLSCVPNEPMRRTKQAATTTQP
jgi:hypothetical protein